MNIRWFLYLAQLDGAGDSTPGGSESARLLEDGVSGRLLEDGTSDRLLEG